MRHNPETDEIQHKGTWTKGPFHAGPAASSRGFLIKMPFSSGILKLLIAGRGCESSLGCWVDLWERFKPEWSFIPSVSLSSVHGVLCYSPVLFLQHIRTFVLVPLPCFPLPPLFSPCPRLGGSVDITPVLLSIPNFPESTSCFFSHYFSGHVSVCKCGGLNCYHVPLDHLKSF